MCLVLPRVPCLSVFVCMCVSVCLCMCVCACVGESVYVLCVCPMDPSPCSAIASTRVHVSRNQGGLMTANLTMAFSAFRLELRCDSSTTRVTPISPAEGPEFH